MAYIISNKLGEALKIAKTMEELHILIGGASSLGLYTEGHCGALHTVSDEDFVNVQTGQKIFNYENSTITYTENPAALEGTKNKESLDAFIQTKIQNIDNCMSNEGRPTIRAKLNSWKTVLQNLDTSVLSYPINSTIEKYLLDQGQEIFSSLQR